MARLRAVLMVLLVTSGAVAAPHHPKTPPAQPAPAPANDTPDPAPIATHSEGEYGGVSPGKPEKPKKPVQRGTLSWIGFEAKGDRKSTVALSHERLPDSETAATMKAFWRERLSGLKALLEAR